MKKIAAAAAKKSRIEKEPPLFDQFAFSVNQAARMTSLSRSSILKEIEAGVLPAIKRRGRVIVLAESLREYLNKEQLSA